MYCMLNILIVVSNIISGSTAIAFCPEIISMELMNFPFKPIYFSQMILLQIYDYWEDLQEFHALSLGLLGLGHIVPVGGQALTVAMS